MYYPWDFTVSIMDLEGKCIDHDYLPAVHNRVIFDHPWDRVIKEKTGSFCWINNFKSATMREIFCDEDYEIRRITKLYFKQFDKIKVIVTFELHLNILYQLPKNLMQVSADITKEKLI